MNRKNITLVSFGPFENTYLSKLADTVGAEFKATVSVINGHVDLINFYESARRQYNGERLLKFVASLPIAEKDKVVGLFNVDLFIPILTYIFGQAYLNGNTGIASIYRLMNEKYGMKPNKLLQYNRFTKEVIHEIGHMSGLVHCYHPECVMRSSTYVEEIDQKGLSLCESCKAKVHKA
jgi:archaemetzincin